MNTQIRNNGLWFSRAILIFTCTLVLLPVIYQFGISLKPPDQVFAQPLAPIQFPLSFENYQNVLNEMPVLRYLLNSFLFSAGVTLGQLALALPAAYAFAYYQFRFKNLLLGLVLLSLMVPFVVTYIPNYLLIANWRLLNTLPGMILPMLGVSLGFGIFLLRQHFLSFPREVTEAAMIDGADRLQILRFIIIPANLSPIVAVAVYVLINSWNQFIWPLLIGGGKEESYTLTVAVQLLYANPEGGAWWGRMLAASALTSLPTLLMYLLMRKMILRTFVEGAVKG